MLSIDFSIASWFACSIASLCLFWLAIRFFVLSISVGLLLIIAFEDSFFSITFLSFASLTFLLLFFFTLPVVIVYLPMVFIRHFFIIVVSVLAVGYIRLFKLLLELLVVLFPLCLCSFSPFFACLIFLF